jgi:urease subunit beta
MAQQTLNPTEGARKMATQKPHTAAKTPVGGYVLSDKPIEINAGRPTVTIKVRNTGDRPIQVGSHFHFFEVNRALEFDRKAAFGQHLDIPASTGLRFEPGDEKEVTLVPFGGKHRIYGFNNLVDGWTGTGPTPGYRPNLDKGLERASERGFKSKAKKP